jgi:hypothetical protein
MPRYFLDIVDGTRIVDEEGQELPDIAAARAVAVAGARSIMREEIWKGRLPLKERIEIRDDRQKLVATVRFRDAVLIDD